MRILGVDFGSKRIGLAVGDLEHRVASPRHSISSVEGLAANVQTLLDIAKSEQADAFAVGVPYGLGGEETPMAKVCLRLIQRLREEGAEVFEVDESMTSVQAEAALRSQAWTAARRKAHRDSEAACQILERYFAEHGDEAA